MTPFSSRTCQNNYLELMGIERWRLKTPLNHNPANNPQQIISESAPEEDNLTQINSLAACVADCTRCDLHKSRKQTVFGAGSLKANIMFIGEAPGAEEDRQGKPFIGRAGLLLTQMLNAINLSRTEIFITNIIKCRPPQNRDPLPIEVETCTPYLKKQIALIQPKLLVALGRVSAHYLLNTKSSLSKLRGQLYEYASIPLLVTYHPAYLLRAPQDKAKSYEDLRKIQSLQKTL